MRDIVIWTVVGVLSLVTVRCMQLVYRRKKSGMAVPGEGPRHEASRAIFSPDGRYAVRAFTGIGRLFSFEEFCKFVETFDSDEDVGSAAWASADGEWVDLQTGRWVPVQPSEIRKGERPESFFTHIRHYGGLLKDLLANKSHLFPASNYEIRPFLSVGTLYSVDEFRKRLTTRDGGLRGEVSCWASAYGEWLDLRRYRTWMRADIDAIGRGERPEPYFTHVHSYKVIDRSQYSGLGTAEILASNGALYAVKPFAVHADLIPLQEFKELLKRYHFSDGWIFWACGDGEWVRLETASRIDVIPSEFREGKIPEPFFTHIHHYPK